jgi:hypothetical protein
MSDTFRVLVTGSRSWPSEDAVWEALAFVCAEDLPDGGTLTVVHGACKTGADRFARTWCTLPNPDVTVVEERHPADWGHCTPACYHQPRRGPDGSKRCPFAGPRRNAEMVALGADLVLAFPLPGDRKLSRGTWNCVDTARKAGLTVEIIAPAGPRFTAVEVAEARRAAQA